LVSVYFSPSGISITWSAALPAPQNGATAAIMASATAAPATRIGIMFPPGKIAKRNRLLSILSKDIPSEAGIRAEASMSDWRQYHQHNQQQILNEPPALSR
jgi:hypothetical protein